MADRYPLTMTKYSHGDLVANTTAEETAYSNMGWVAQPNEPPAYQLFPMYLRGPDLPDLLVENEDEAKAAAQRGYRLPSDTQIEAAEQNFAAAFEVEDEDYEPAEYPKHLAHPDFVAETPGHWTYDRRPGGVNEGRFIPGKPAKLAPVLVNSPDDEAEWVAKGWTIGAEPLRSAVAHETWDPAETTSEAEDRNHASAPSIAAARKRPSGAQWRKRRQSCPMKNLRGIAIVALGLNPGCVQPHLGALLILALGLGALAPVTAHAQYVTPYGS